jgi:hypothetical protein
MRNDCTASGTTITVVKPELVESDVTSTGITVPKSPLAKPPHSFTVTDTVTNTGPVPSTATLTRYYISLKPEKDYTALLLTGSRSIRALPGNPNPANWSTGSARLKLPLGKTDKSAAYYLFACSNDTEKPENGPSDCAASSPPEISCSGCH